MTNRILNTPVPVNISQIKIPVYCSKLYCTSINRPPLQTGPMKCSNLDRFHCLCICTQCIQCVNVLSFYLFFGICLTCIIVVSDTDSGTFYVNSQPDKMMKEEHKQMGYKVKHPLLIYHYLSNPLFQNSSCHGDSSAFRL